MSGLNKMKNIGLEQAYQIKLSMVDYINKSEVERRDQSREDKSGADQFGNSILEKMQIKLYR